jgi:pyruvate,water dikinase
MAELNKLSQKVEFKLKSVIINTRYYMKFTKTFEQLGKGDANIAGGKGASLGEMTQAGIPVPPGFVVTAQAFDYFLEKCEIKADIASIFDKVNHKDTNSVENASGEIQSIIKNAVMPLEIEEEIKKDFATLDAELVAVRSSATAEDSSSASWAGELDSFLNTTKDNLLDNVKNCWASLFTPRAIFYRFEKELHLEDVSVAVVVQKMVQSQVSGITFTVHPVTEDPNQMVIEAGWGLGEAIVGGIITPDTFVIDKSKVLSPKPNAEDIITGRYISEQEIMIVRSPEGTKEVPVEDNKREIQKFDDEKLIELAKICLGIEKHYGFPCDIEWAMESDALYIVQSRPITTLS